MFFEGSEKKAEIIIDASQGSLLKDFNDNFWSAMVQKCGARILSSIHNRHCCAYLLSESSLFVWHDRVIILTCGQTELIHSVTFLLQQLNPGLVKEIIYQRKNEQLSSAQNTTFIDDVKQLPDHQQGTGYLFGEMHGHHQYLYHRRYAANQQQRHQAQALYQHSDQQSGQHSSNRSHEILFYKISQSASELFTSSQLSAERIRRFFGLEQLLDGFAIDDHLFHPCGYSLNAIKGQDYFTIHLTPQSISSYVSFESSLDLLQILPLLIEILAPKALDIICYNQVEFEQTIKQRIPEQFICKNSVAQQLQNATQVNFACFITPQPNTSAAAQINLTGADNSLRLLPRS